MTFTTWLKQYRETAAPLGDLARDVKRDDEWPDSNDHHVLERYLQRVGCREAQETFAHAWEMYNAARGNVPTGFVYFIQAGDSGPIKIGYSDNVDSRLRSMQTGNHERLRLLCKVPGSYLDEGSLHKRFDIYRLSGEWFRPHYDITDFIEEIIHGSRPGNLLSVQW